MKFFEYIIRHYDKFYWLSLAYVIAVLVLQLKLELHDNFSLWAIIPLNLITWPVAIGGWRDKKLRRYEWRFIFALVALTTIAPILLGL